MESSTYECCKNLFAQAMLCTDEYLARYKEQIKTLEEKGLLPDLKKSMFYKVYTIQGNQAYAHQSVVLTTNDKHFVTVELGFHEVDNTKYIYPVTKQYIGEKSKLKFEGVTTQRGEVLISKAVTTMKEFGCYHMWCNNCRSFCSKYIKSIGTEKSN